MNLVKLLVAIVSCKSSLFDLSGTTSTSVVQSTTAGSGGRRGQAIKSEAHTTTTGRPRSHKRQMMQHRIHENNNQVSRFELVFSISG